MLPLDKRGLKNVLLQDSFSSVLPTLTVKKHIFIRNHLAESLRKDKQDNESYWNDGGGGGGGADLVSPSSHNFMQPRRDEFDY